MAVKKRKGEAGLKKLHTRYKKEAKERGYSFDLTENEMRAICVQNCFYCDMPPKQYITTTCPKATIQGKEWAGFTYNGLDRLDNSIGYSIENCVACCKQCNRAKSDMTVLQFKEWINKIYNWSIKGYAVQS